MTITLRTLITALALTIAPICTQAGIFSTNFGTTTYTGGVINYSVDLSGSILNPGDFLTLYDAGLAPTNLAGMIANAALFAISTNLTDTPAPNLLGIVDSPTISNIRFTYIGSAGFNGANLGSFSLPDPTGTYRLVSIDDRHNGTSDSSQDGAPVLSTASVPDTGSSVLLLGVGIAAISGAQRALRHRDLATA